MGDEDSSHSEENVELTLANLVTPDAVVSLGQKAVAMLKSFGTATFLLDEQGQVRLANPLQVYIDSSIAYPPEGVEPRFVRPILTNGRPQFVAKKPDGSLWEVEYPRPGLDLTLADSNEETLQ